MGAPPPRTERIAVGGRPWGIRGELASALKANGPASFEGKIRLALRSFSRLVAEAATSR